MRTPATCSLLVLSLLALSAPAAGQQEPGRRREIGRAADAAVELLSSKHASDRFDAAEKLAFLGDARAVPLLGELVLRDQKTSVRQAATTALGRLGDPGGVPALARALAQDPEEKVRVAAAWALGELGHPSGATALAGALDDARPLVRRVAAAALRQLPAPQAADAIARAIARQGELREVRFLAALALARLGDSRAVPALLAEVRGPGREAGPGAGPSAEEVIEESEEDAENAGEEVLDDLEIYLHDDDPDWRFSLAAAALGRLGVREAVPALAAVLGGEEPRFTAAVRALHAIGDAEGGRALDRLGLDAERPVVFPFANETGEADLDWLGYGLQAAFTADLGRMPSFDPWLFRLQRADRFDPGRRDEMLAAARRDYEADQVWYGEYERDGGAVRVHVRALRVADGAELARLDFAAPLADLPARVSEAALSLAAALGEPADAATAERVRRAPAPRSPEAWRQLSLARELGHQIAHPEALGTTAGALLARRAEAARRASDLDAGLAAAHEVLGSTLEELGDLEGALAAFRRGAELDPTLPTAHLGIARVRGERGETAESLAAFEAAAQAGPWLSEIAADRLRALVDQARRDAASRVADPTNELMVRSAFELPGPALDLAWRLAKSRFSYPRGQALFALALVPVPAALPLVAEALDDPGVRLQAVAGMAPGVPTGRLLRLLRDPDPALRAAAAAAAGLRDATFVPALFAALDDPAAEVRSGAVLALSRLALFAPLWRVDDGLDYGGDRPGAALDLLAATVELAGEPVPQVRRQACAALGRLSREPRGLEALLRCLGDGDAAVRAQAATTLATATMPAEQFAAGIEERALATALRDPDAGVRQAAAASLRTRGEGLLRSSAAAEVLSALEGALADPVPAVAMQAAVALGTARATHAVEPLLARLGDPVLGVCSTAVWALGQIGDRRAVAPLLAALGRETPEMRAVVLQSLAWLGAAEALPHFRAGVRSPLAAERAAACAGLGALRDREAAGSLRAALADPAPTVRWAAAWALGRIEDPRAVPDLVRATADADGQVRAAAVDALIALRSEEAAPFLRGRLDAADAPVRTAALDALAALSRRRARPELLAALDSPHPDLRLRAAQWSRRIGDPATEPPLLRLLADRAVDVRRAAAAALGQLASRRSGGALRRALADSDSEVRRLAAVALGGLRDPAAVPELATALRNPGNVLMSNQAIEALQRIGDPAAAPALVEVLGRSDLGPARFPAAYALAVVGSAADVPALLAAVDDREPVVAMAALASLERLGGAAVLPQVLAALPPGDAERRELVARYWGAAFEDPQPAAGEEEALGELARRSPTRWSAVMRLSGSDSPRARAALVATLQDPYPLVAEAAAFALTAPGREPSAEAVERLRSGGPVERWVAAMVQARRGDRAARDELAAGLETFPPMLQSAAVTLLGELREPRAVPALAALLPGNSWAKPSVLQALGRIGDASAAAAVERLLDAGEPRLWSAAATALLQISGEAAVGRLLPVLERACAAGDGAADGNAVDEPAAPCRDTAAVLASFAASAPRATRDAVALDLYRLLGRHESPGVLRALVWARLFPADWDALPAPPGPFARLSLLYLAALQASERRAPGAQRDLAMRALASPDATGETGLALACSWLEVHAELSLGRSAEALETARAATRALAGITLRDRRELGELLEEETLYWQGRALAEQGGEQALVEARSAMEKVRHSLASRRWLALPPATSEDVARLEEMAGSRLGLFYGALQRTVLSETDRAAGDRPARDMAQFEDREKRLLELARLALLDDDASEESYRTAQAFLEKLQLARRQYVQRGFHIELADPDKQRALADLERRDREIQALRRQVEELQRAGAAPAGAPGLDPLRAELAEKDRALARFVADLKRAHPDLAALVRAEPIDLKRVQDLLPADVALVQYLLLPDELVTFVVRAGGIEIVKASVPREELAAKVRAYLDGYLALLRRLGVPLAGQEGLLATRGFRPTGRQRAAGAPAADADMEALAADLYGLLIRPLEARGALAGIHQLGIVPNGFLHYLPFAALVAAASTGEPEYLVDRYALFEVHSTSLLWTALDRGGAAGRDLELVALSNPDLTLEGAEREVAAIAPLFARHRLYPRERATRAVLRTPEAAARVVHLATHGVLDGGDSTASYLLLADGKLTVEEIWGLPFKGVALTTLSACQTGVGEVLSGDDLVSLESAFIYAGSASVVATLWPVLDLATAELMERFYSGLRGGASKAEALAAAQRHLKAQERWRHPVFWAGVTLHGAWR